MSKEDAIEAAEGFAQALIDKYGCAVKCVIHYKNGQHDHAHFIITDRKVGPEGISKIKIRELNGVAMKREGQGILDKGKEKGFPRFQPKSTAVQAHRPLS